MARMVGTIDLTIGPTLRTALDVLDLACELFALVPEWHAAELERLKERADALVDRCNRDLHVRC